MPANRLRELRERAHLTLAELGEQIGVDASTISRWELQVSGIPDPRKQQLAEFFAVSVPYLMAWDEPNGNDDDKERKAA